MSVSGRSRSQRLTTASPPGPLIRHYRILIPSDCMPRLRFRLASGEVSPPPVIYQLPNPNDKAIDDFNHMLKSVLFVVDD